PVPDAKNFVAHLTGGNEVPTHDTRAAGQIKLQLSDDGTEVAYRLISSNIDNVFMAHIHVAPAGVNGPIVVFLFGPVAPGGGRVDGVLAHGTFTAANLIGPLTDRKSTRLNSSHVAISYAVFCLKKKKNESVQNCFVLDVL